MAKQGDRGLFLTKENRVQTWLDPVTRSQLLPLQRWSACSVSVSIDGRPTPAYRKRDRTSVAGLQGHTGDGDG